MTPTPGEHPPHNGGLGLPVRTHGLGVDYGRHRALDGVDLDLDAPGIHALLGRNGAGKTTLLSVLASLRPPSRGEVEIGGRDPFEDAEVMSQVCLVRDGGDVVGDQRLGWNLEFRDLMRTDFDLAWAQELLARFGLDPRSKPNNLSRGQRSAFHAVLGLASRARLTMYDEVHLGMDAPTRQLFTDLLLADFVERPHTIVLSSHLISEVEPLVETVTILHEGRVLLRGQTDDIRRRGLTITGPAHLVNDMASALDVVASRALGPTLQVTAFGDTDPALVREAQRRGLQVEAAPLQDLFIHLTEEPS